MVHRVEHRFVRHELHHGLGRVDVHVHRLRRQGDVQHAAGELALQQPVAVALLHGGGEELALHQASVDEEQLPRPRAVARQGLGHEAADAHIAVAAGHRQQRQREIPAQRGVDGGQQLAVSRRVQHLLSVPQQLEGHVRVAQCQLCDHGGGRAALGAVLLHEFHPGGGVVKQVADADGRAHRAARRRHLAGHAALQVQPCARLGRRLAGEHVQPGHGGDGGQRLAPEAQRVDGGQVGGGTQLAGGVAQEGGGQLLRRHAAAVVGDAQIRQPALFQLHGHGGRTGVQRVLQQLLAHAGRTLYHLTGGDEVGDMGGQLLNLGHKSASLFRSVYGHIS